jgi:IclR family acetate operon transcriptional repressor
VLATFEALAEHQPIGVGALARALGDDKSAVQRALMTLSEAGWIRRTSADPARWEVTTRALRIAHDAYQRTGLRERVRPALEQLRAGTGETAILNVPEAGEVVVVDVAESPQMLRTAPAVGFVVPVPHSAAGLAILAALPADELVTYLDGPLDDDLRSRLDDVRRRGWSVNDRDATPGASAVGAAVTEQGRPVASITISGPADRMGHDVLDRLGPIVAAAATGLSTR